jgi:hypothetical protein
MASDRLAAMRDEAETRVPPVSGQVIRGTAHRRLSLPSPRALAMAACRAAGAITPAVVGTAQAASHPPTALQHAPTPSVR